MVLSHLDRTVAASLGLSDIFDISFTEAEAVWSYATGHSLDRVGSNSADPV